MSRKHYVWVDGRGWVPWERRAPRPRVYIQSDSIPDAPQGVRSMLDGRWYDSKSRLRSKYRAYGVQELGNDRDPKAKPEMPDATADIYQAAKELGADLE